MAYVLASNIARQRADSIHSVKWAERAYQLAPDSEDVLLHYTAALGEARDFEKLVNIIKPKVETGKFSKRLDWNYAQVLQQTGLASDAIAVLRKAAAGEAPDNFKSAAETMIDAWSGVLSGCGVQLEIHRSGFLQRPERWRPPRPGKRRFPCSIQDCLPWLPNIPRRSAPCR